MSRHIERPARSSGSLAGWHSGWRVALRMARRDAVRYKGRSALTALLVGLPVLLLTIGVTLYASITLSPQETRQYLVGQGQALLNHPTAHLGYQLSKDTLVSPQGPDGNPQPAQPIPGWRPDNEAVTLSNLTGGTAHRLVRGEVTVTMTNERQRAMQVLGVDGREPLTKGITNLSSGRWPAAPGEVLVTPSGRARGLPDQGTVTVSISDNGQPQTWTIVGTGEGHTSSYRRPHPVELVTLPDPALGVSSWLIGRAEPFGVKDIRALNPYGIFVLPASSIEREFTPDELAALAEGTGNSALSDIPHNTSETLVGIMSVLALTITIWLLAGPAFAVGAQRQRRTLALAASNGASRRHLRRDVLAQAVVLGVASATVCAGTGIALAWILRPLLITIAPTRIIGPFDIPWGQVALITAAAMVASVLSALVPARRLGKLDLIATLRGQSVSPRLHRGMPVIGGALVAIGGVAVIASAFAWNDQSSWVGQQRNVMMPAGSALLVLGTVLTIPLLLHLTARWTTSLPLALRMAARDASRQRGRSTPTVAAIMAGAALLSCCAVAIASDTAQEERDYRPRAPEGWMSIYVRRIGADLNSSGRAAMTTAQIESTLAQNIPGGRLVKTMEVGREYSRTPEGTPAPPQPFATIVPTGCSVQEVLPSQARTDNDARRCIPVGSVPESPSTPDILVLDIDDAVDGLRLSAEEQADLRRGALLLSDPMPLTLNSRDPVITTVDTSTGRVRLEIGASQRSTSGSIHYQDRRTADLPARTIDALRFSRGTVGLGDSATGAIMSTATAQRLGLPLRAAQSTLVGRGSAPITSEQQQVVSDILTGSADLTVERGYQRVDLLQLIVVFIVLGLLILVVTLIATALSIAETASTSATFAAVGATRRTRRSIAAGQAVFISLTGTLLGLLIGLVPGIALTPALTTDPYTVLRSGGVVVPSSLDPVVVIPWLPMAAALIAIPALAGAMAWISIRSAPTVTRRTT